MSGLLEFHHQLIADIKGDADIFGLISVEAFFEKIGDMLTEAGELEEASRAYYEGVISGNAARIDGYGGDPIDGDGVFSLVLCDFEETDEVRLIHKDRLNVLLNQIFRFLNASLKREFREQLEETSVGFGVADLINTRWNKIEKIKLIIATNADSRTRADAAKVTEFNDRPVTVSVWDLKRIKQYFEQGQARANLMIDFENDFNAGIPILKASGTGTSLDSYLAVFPGKQLALIYDKWGPRLLESNVRSFLQARSKVNRGIRDTIRNAPNMFFPYNNGLSATADSIDVTQTEQGLELVRADNFQIVNGGQTTASLHAALKTNATELENVHVQVKLTIVPKEQTEQVVPKISEYANSQNKVNAADFFSNHPFHIRIEELSRLVLAPAGQIRYRETKWFYERARGQYADERGRRTVSERNKFDAEYPRSQFFTKTDLSKYENTWACLPYIVSLGAQKNFTEFAKRMGKLWGADGKTINQLWYKQLIAKAIIFHSTEKLVSKSEWYEGGYRANIVTYGIAKIVADAREQGMEINLENVWRSQIISDELKASLLLAGEEAQYIISNPPEGIRNFSEWAKKQACWKKLSESVIDYEDIDKILIPIELIDEKKREFRAGTSIENSVKAKIEVCELGGEFWKSAVNWSKEKRLLSGMEQDILKICAEIPRKIPSDRQCEIAMSALAKLRNEGFR